MATSTVSSGASPINTTVHSPTLNTFPGPGTLTIFLLFGVIVGMSWAPVRPFVYVLLVILLVDLLLQAEPNITPWVQSNH